MVKKKRLFEKRERRFSSLIPNLFIGGLLLITIWFLVDANIKINNRRNELSINLNRLRAQLNLLQEQKTHYENEIERIKSDEFWEERFREQGYRKPDEKVFVVLPPSASTSTEEVHKKNFLERFLEKIGF